MAIANTAPVITAVREVLDSGHGNLRTIATTRFEDTLTEDLTEDALQTLSMHAAAAFRVRITGMRKNRASAPINSSVILRDIDLEVTVSRTIPIEGRISADSRADLEALAADDADAIAQALETAPNLQATVGGTATNLAGDCVRYVDSRMRVVRGTPDGAQRIETVHRFTGVLKVSPATS